MTSRRMLCALFFALTWSLPAAAQNTVVPGRLTLSTGPCQVVSGSATPTTEVATAMCGYYFKTDGTIYTKPAGSATWTQLLISGGGGGTGITASSTDTLTNKTLDAEGTGNVLTLPVTYTFTPAACNGSTASVGISLPPSGPAVAACVTGTNTNLAVLQFAASSDLTAQGHFTLPSDWTGAIDLHLLWRCTPTTGNVVWQMSGTFVAAGATVDPAFNAANTVTSAAAGSANQLTAATISSITTTGSAAGAEFFWKLERNAGSGSDTMSGTAELISMYFVVRRAM